MSRFPNELSLKTHRLTVGLHLDIKRQKVNIGGRDRQSMLARLPPNIVRIVVLICPRQHSKQRHLLLHPQYRRLVYHKCHQSRAVCNGYICLTYWSATDSSCKKGSSSSRASRMKGTDLVQSDASQCFMGDNGSIYPHHN